MPRYIDAFTLYDEIESLRITVGGVDMFPKFAKESVLECIELAGTADVQEVQHGTWEYTNDGAARCMSCKRKMNPYVYGYAFCPLCGARMDGEKK